MEKERNGNSIDEIDIAIINELLLDAKTAYVDISAKINMSVGTVHTRIKKLEKIGVIAGSTIALNLSKLGLNTSAFIGIFLERSSFHQEISTQLLKIPEVTHIYYTTGIYGIFIKVLCQNNEHLKKLLSENIQRIKGITRTETTICLEEQQNKNNFIELNK